MTVLADRADIEARWRTIPDEQFTQVMVWLDDASRLVRESVPRVDERIADGTLDRSTVAYVVCQVVIRRLENPTAARTTTETTGPFMSVRSYGDQAREGLYLTADERRRLLPPSSRSGGVGTVRLRSVL